MTAAPLRSVSTIFAQFLVIPLTQQIALTGHCTVLQTSFLLANEGVPRIWNVDLSPNKAYAAVVQSVPGDTQHLQVSAMLANGDLIVMHN